MNDFLKPLSKRPSSQWWLRLAFSVRLDRIDSDDVDERHCCNKVEGDIFHRRPEPLVEDQSSRRQLHSKRGRKSPCSAAEICVEWRSTLVRSEQQRAFRSSDQTLSVLGHSKDTRSELRKVLHRVEVHLASSSDLDDAMGNSPPE